MKISQCLSEYLIDHQIKGSSPHTLRYYRSNITAFMAFSGDVDTVDISLPLLKSYVLSLRQRDITSTTVQTYVRALRAFLKWLYREGYISVNLCERFRLPKATRKTIDVLTDSEIDRLLDCFNVMSFIGLRNMCIVLLMLDSGLRTCEVISLKLDAVHIDYGYAVVTGKGDKERFVPLGLNTKKYILRYLMKRPCTPGETHLFVKDDMTTLKNTTVRQLFRKLKTAADIPRLRPHLLRHTFATRYLENGGDIYSLQSILGHTSLEMVKRYVHITPGKTAVSFCRYSPVDTLMKNPARLRR